MGQTFISVFEDARGMTIDFERWEYKRLETCIDALTKLYHRMRAMAFVQEDLAKVTRIVTYKTSYEISQGNIVSEIDIATFMKMIE